MSEDRGEFANAAARLAGLTGVLLGWRPGEFWAATPAELGCVIGAMMGEGGEPGLASAEFEALRERFPDG